jgi:hypothetical protein
MRKILLAATVLVGAALAGCSALPTNGSQPVISLADIQTAVVKQCTVAVPFLNDMNAMKSQFSSAAAQTDLATAQQKVGDYCAPFLATVGTAPAITVADVQALVNQGVPSLIKLVDQSGWTDQQKGAAELAIGAAQLVITQKLQGLAANTTLQ